MPDSDSAPAITRQVVVAAATAEHSGSDGLTAEVVAVVARWNPQGSVLLQSVPATGLTEMIVAQPYSVPVLLIGPDDANTAVLRAELARFEPAIELTDPMADPPPAASTVALYLLDAGAPAGADDLATITRLYVGGTRIVFALNNIHAHQDWRDTAARNIRLLGPAIGSVPELVPVSARLAVAARAAGDAALLDRSGVAILHARLAAAIGAGIGDRHAAARSRVLADTRRRIHDQVSALRSGAAVAEVRAERAALLVGRDGGRAQAMVALRNRLQLARVDLLHDVGARVRAVNTAARAELDRLNRRAARGYPERLQRSVTRLTAELDTLVVHRLAEVAHQIEVVTGPNGSAAVPVPVADPPPTLGSDPEPRHRGAEDNLMIALGASGGFGLGRLVVAPLALVPALDYATVPITLLLGAGVAAWVVRARGHLADRAHLRQWVSDALVNVKAELEQRVATALVEAESQLTDQVVATCTARAVETDRRVAELESRLRELTSQRPAQLAACERDLAVLAVLPQ